MTTPADADWEPWIGYLRVSTWKEEKISPELQQAAIEAWALRTRRRIVAWVPDLDVTGRNFNRRIMECIERTEAGDVRGVVVWKFSRFGRSRDGISLNLKRLEDAGGQLVSATEEVDARTATGRLQRGILFEFAAYESDVRGEQWRETFDHRHYKLHLPACGRRRFGYLWTPRTVPDPAAPGGIRIQEERYDAHPEQGPVLADQYRQYTDGSPLRSLVLGLNADGWRTVRGGLWSVQTLIRYMDSGFAAALLRVHNPQCGCSGKRRRNCTNMVHIPGAQEELISPELWQAYTERRAEQRITPPRARVPVYPLTNLVRCGLCRGTAPAASKEVIRGGVRSSVRGYAYHCGRNTRAGLGGCPGLWIKRADVEAAVMAWMIREGSVVVDSAAADPPPTPAVNRRAQAARQQAALQAEHDRLAAALTTLRVQRAADPDEWGPGEYEAARDRIRQQQAEVTAQMETAAAVAAIPDRADFLPLAVSLADEWDAYDYGQRNRILRRLLRRVILTRTSEGVTVDVEPLWEADRWADQAFSHA